MILPDLLPVAAFLSGLLIGSFLNVCIYRMPKGESVVRPRSRCPYCGRGVLWYDNIPVVSFVLLRGRCRSCGAALSAVYPIVELATGILYAVLVVRYGLSLLTVKYAVLVSTMLVLAFADLADRILPDTITLGGTAVGLAFSVIQPLEPGFVSVLLSIWEVRPGPIVLSGMESAVGAALSAGVLYLVAEAYYRIRFREGMGFGDVKMMALIGAFLGTGPALWTVMLASVLGAVLGLIFVLAFRKGMLYELPFGTFLAFAAILIVVV